MSLAPETAMIKSEEIGRVAFLARLAILDTEAEPAFDALVQVARVMFGMSGSLIALLIGSRQWDLRRTRAPLMPARVRTYMNANVGADQTRISP